MDLSFIRLPAGMEMVIRWINLTVCIVLAVAIILAVHGLIVEGLLRPSEICFVQGVVAILLALAYGTAEVLWPHTLPQIRPLVLLVGLVWLAASLVMGQQEKKKRSGRRPGPPRTGGK